MYIRHSNSGEAVSTYLFEPTRERCKTRRIWSLTKVSRASALDQLGQSSRGRRMDVQNIYAARNSPHDDEFKCRKSS